MKFLNKVIILAVLALISAIPAAAQFSFGPKVGVAVNSLHFNKNLGTELISSDNRAGFTGGLTMELMVPVLNLGFDASVMYVHRSISAKTPTSSDFSVYNRDYIEIPLNLKWKIGLPLVGKIITPYLFTGPSFAFLVSKQAALDAIQNKKFDVSWNFGLGVQLFKKVQVGASYGLGITKAVTGAKDQVEGKNRYWTITAAYLF